MNGFTPLTGAQDQVPSYLDRPSVVETNSQEGQSPVPVDHTPESTPLSQQQQREERTSLEAQSALVHLNAEQQYFSASQLISHDYSDWDQVESIHLRHLATRAAKTEQRTFIWMLKQEELRLYLSQCWDNLQTNFQLLYKQIRSKP